MRTMMLLAYGLCVIALIGAGFAEHDISDESLIEINGIFGTSGGRNWTAPSSEENVTISIKNNESSTGGMTSVNVTMPDGFILDNETIANSMGWNCENVSLYTISCSNDTEQNILDVGETISIWLNATSPSIETETSYSWTVATTDNATNESSTSLTTWVDGAVTDAAEPSSPTASVNTMPVTLNWTANQGTDSVSGISNYTIYNSSDGENYTIMAVLPHTSTSYSITGLVPNTTHYFRIETRDRAGNMLNSSTTVNTTYDISEPTVSLNTTDLANFTSTRYPRLYFNTTDNFDNNMSCELFVDGIPSGTGDAGNASTGISIASNRSVMGTHTWHVNCTDDAGNTGASSTRQFNIQGADVEIVSVYFNTTNDPNPITSSNITITAVLNNSGNINLTANATLNFYIDEAYIDSATVENTTLIPAGTLATFSVSKTGINYDGFNHTIKANVSYDGVELDSIDDNTNYNRSLYIGYNITITSTVASAYNAGEQIDLVASVRYPNGSAVLNLDRKNITVDDMHSAGTHTWGGDSLNLPFGSVNLYNETFTDNDDGTYSFSIYTYNKTDLIAESTRQGTHTIYISAENNESGDYFNGYDDSETYLLNAPMFDILYTSDHTTYVSTEELDNPYDIATDENLDVYIYVNNTGNINLEYVNISISFIDGGAIESIDTDTCNEEEAVNYGGAPTYICKVTVTSDDSADNNEVSYLNITVYGVANSTRYAFSETAFRIRIDEESDTPSTTPTTTNTDTSGGGVTTSTSTSYPNCEDNTDCFFNEYCSTSLCKELSCASDEEAKNHKCVKKTTTTTTEKTGLEITGGPDTLEIEHLTSRNTTFDITNHENTTITALSIILKIDNMENTATNWYVVKEGSPTEVAGLNSASFDVTIMTENLEIGTYNMKAIITGTDASAEKTFTIKVMPNENEKTYVNYTMSQIESDYEKLFNQLQYEIYKNPESADLAELNSTCENLKYLIESAKEAVITGDYLAAYEMQTSAKEIIAEMKTRIGQDETEDGESHFIRNTILTIIIIAGAYIGYNYYINMEPAGKKIGGHHNYKIKGDSSKRNDSGTLSDISYLKHLVKGNEKGAPTPTRYDFNSSYGKKEKTEKKGIKKIVSSITSKVKRKGRKGQKTLYDIANKPTD